MCQFTFGEKPSILNISGSLYSFIMRALITGISGQDGSYLAEHLLGNGYVVYGTVRRPPEERFERLHDIQDKLTLLHADLMDPVSLTDALRKADPDEIYHLAAQSFIPASWTHPVLTAEFTAIGTSRMLEATRTVCPQAKFYQASTSEMFGRVAEAPQNEQTPFSPVTPYGSAKLYGHNIALNYRNTHHMFAVSGILYNHESPRRGLEFVTRKITDSVARIKLGRAKELMLGSLDAERDWGFAGDYVLAMWQMLQRRTPSDYVIATGKIHSVRQFAEIAFGCVGLKYEQFVKTDPTFLRPSELTRLVGDSTKAHQELDWRPRVGFEQMIDMMVRHDMDHHSRRG